MTDRVVVLGVGASLQDRYDPHNNGLGALRLGLALAVLVAHCWPLGLGEPNLGLNLTQGQADLGSLAVDGFFILSGFLVAASAARGGAVRFVWRRFLRIFPGLWVCLSVTAAAAWLAGHDGAGAFLRANWAGSVHQWGIGTLFLDTPYGRLVGTSVVNGSLWSLAYELLCYAGLAVLVAVRLPRLAIPVAALVAYAVIVADAVRDPSSPHYHGGLGPFPLLGYVDAQLACYLGFLFLLGASAQRYAHRVPLRPALAAVAGAVLAGSLVLGGFYPLGYPALAYLLLYAACSLPARTHRIGREHDYSYGIYIYAFPIQQAVAQAGGARFGVALFLACCVPLVLAAAALSWHFVGRPALTLRSFAVPSGRRVPSSRPGEPSRPARGWRRRPGRA